MAKSLYQTLKGLLPAAYLDHHESDLYVRKTPLTVSIIRQFGANVSSFKSDKDGHEWLDVPFAYEPFWEKKAKSRKGAPSGEGTLEAATRKPNHASKKSAWPSVVGSHGLGTYDVATKNGAYWIVTVPTGHRVDYKPWGPSNEISLGTFPSRRRAQAEIRKHSR